MTSVLIVIRDICDFPMSFFQSFVTSFVGLLLGYFNLFCCSEPIFAWTCNN
jgi:hypothetical protein